MIKLTKANPIVALSRILFACFMSNFNFQFRF